MNRRSLLKALALVGAAPAVANAEPPQEIAEVLTSPMPDLFQGDGWYNHKERVGTLSVHYIERIWSDMDREWIYPTKTWPALHSYFDNVFSEDEVNRFIHSPSEWVPGPDKVIQIGEFRVRREF